MTFKRGSVCAGLALIAALVLAVAWETRAGKRRATAAGCGSTGGVVSTTRLVYGGDETEMISFAAYQERIATDPVFRYVVEQEGAMDVEAAPLS